MPPLTRNQQAALVQQGHSSSSSASREVEDQGHGSTGAASAAALEQRRDCSRDQHESADGNVARSSSRLTAAPPTKAGRNPSANPGQASATGPSVTPMPDPSADRHDNQGNVQSSSSLANSSDWAPFDTSHGSALPDDVFAHSHSNDDGSQVFDPTMPLPSTVAGLYHSGGGGSTDMQPFMNDADVQDAAAAAAESQRHLLLQQQPSQQHPNRRHAPESAEDSLLASLQSQIDQLSPDRHFAENASHRPHHHQTRGSYNLAAVAATTAAAVLSNNEQQQHGRQRSDSTLSTAFSTPSGNMSRIHSPQDHSRNFSLDSLESMAAAAEGRGVSRHSLGQYGGPAGSADSSLSMDVDSVNGGSGGPVRPSNRQLRMTGSPIKRHSAAPSDAAGSGSELRTRTALDRQIRSLGQMGAAISQGGVDDGLLRLGGGPMRPLAPAGFDRFGMHHANSARSLSPPEHGTMGFSGSFSPRSSISTIRHAGDSSIDTSTDSISNSATTMSGVPSQASSVSEDVMIGGSAASKKLPKIKTRLRNIDRKAICEAARDDPKIRQEDLALRFGIERSTVSKTLKNKDKWLAIEEESNGAMIMKHRLGKFPELEEHLARWINKEVGTNAPILDSTIKHRALQVAKDLGITLDQFKASVGWIDKFRERHKLRKVNAISSDADLDRLPIGMASSEEEAHRQRLRARFQNGMALALHQQQGPSSGTHDGNPLTGDSTSSSDVSMFYSPPPTGDNGGGGGNSVGSMSINPPHSSTPQRRRSTSVEAVLSGIHETPKASKRHYDDMINAAAAARTNANINSSMANMHIPTESPSHQQHPHLQLQHHPHLHHQHQLGQTPQQQQQQHHHQQQQQQHQSLQHHHMLSQHQKHQQHAQIGLNLDGSALQRSAHDDSGFAMPMHDSASLSAPSSVAAAKRRKGTSDANKIDVAGSDAVALSALREQLRRTRSEQFFGAPPSASHSSPVSVQQHNEVALAAVAAAQEIRRSEEFKSMMAQQRGMMQGNERRDDDLLLEGGGGGGGGGMHSVSSSGSPADQVSFMRAMQYRAMSGATAHAAMYAPHAGGSGSPMAFIGTPPSRSDMLGMSQAQGDLSLHESPVTGTPGGADDRAVTLDEARESLDVVLAFISRQSATLSPSDYFVLGNLQGQLNALANQFNGHDASDIPATPMHPAKSGGGGGNGVRAHGPGTGSTGNEEAMSHTNELNLLGITPGDLSMVGDLAQHRGPQPPSA